MDGLKRSEISFRRQGSSGLVWEDRFISGELKKKEDLDKQKQQQQAGGKEEVEFRELRPSRSVGSTGGIGGGINTVALERSRSNGGVAVGGGYRTGKVSPALDPPSPKLSGCGFCSVFGKPQKSTNTKNKNNNQHNNQRSKKGKRKS